MKASKVLQRPLQGMTQHQQTHKPPTSPPQQQGRRNLSYGIKSEQAPPRPAPRGAIHQNPSTSPLHPRTDRECPSEPFPPSTSAKIRLNIRRDVWQAVTDKLLGRIPRDLRSPRIRHLHKFGKDEHISILSVTRKASPPHHHRGADPTHQSPLGHQ